MKGGMKMDYKKILNITVRLCVVFLICCLISVKELEGVYKTLLALLTGAFGGVFIFSLFLLHAERRSRILKMMRGKKVKKVTTSTVV